MDCEKMKISFYDCKAIRQTEKALLVYIPDLETEEWIPQSCVDDDSEVYKKGDCGELVIFDYFAKSKGWV
jgi:hypothetical protein